MTTRSSFQRRACPSEGMDTNPENSRTKAFTIFEKELTAFGPLFAQLSLGIK